jgi:hypothetical protein
LKWSVIECWLTHMRNNLSVSQSKERRDSDMFQRKQTRFQTGRWYEGYQRLKVVFKFCGFQKSTKLYHLQQELIRPPIIMD